jgi:lambda family phage portal protein
MYDAAKKGRRTKGWQATNASANIETALSLDTLRARSRELIRNNPYAKRAVQSISTNTTGNGIRPVPKNQKDGPASKLKGLWEDWAESTDCDFDGQGNFYSLQRLAMRCIAESGEVLIRKRRDASLDIPMQIQILEPDFLDHTKNSVIFPAGNMGTEYSIQGVQFDKRGKKLGYWLYDIHPGEGGFLKSNFVPASEVLHVYYKERPGQVRGVPFNASAALSLYDFDEYEQAQLIRQKVAACFSVFVTDTDLNITTPPGGVAPTTQPREKVEPGIIEHLPAGKSVTMANPPGVTNYDEYATSILRKIAAGNSVSYEVLTGDYSNVNFSSGRMGWIEFHRLITEWQNLMLVPMMLDPIWGWFCEAVVIAGKHNNKKVKAKWTPPRREMIDPVKETNALMLLVRNGFESWSSTVSSLGKNPEEVLQEITDDYKNFDKNKLMLACDPRYDPTRTNGALPDPNADGTGAETPTESELTPKQAKQAKKKNASA